MPINTQAIGLLKALVLIFLLYFVITQTLNAEVYRWVDKDGKVHYSDKPMDDSATEFKVGQEVSEQDAEAAHQQADRLIALQKRRVGNELQANSERRQQQADEDARERRTLAECKRATRGLRILEMQVPVYRTDESGEQKFFSDETRQKEIQRLKDFLSANCEN